MNKDEITNAFIDLHQLITKQGERTDKRIAKLNLAVGELRLSFMKLDERVSTLGVEINERITTIDDRITTIDDRITTLHERMTTLNESVIRYAKSNEARLNGHETRIERLEEQSSGGSYTLKEPEPTYKKKKRK